MRYPVAIEPGTDRVAFGVVVPDLPGCFSAGDTLDEAVENAKEAILLHLEDYSNGREPFPEPSELGELRRSRSDFAKWIWMLVEVDESAVTGPAERINISIPRPALRRIDEAAARAGQNRSAFLVNAALRRSNELMETSERRAAPVGRKQSVVRAAEKRLDQRAGLARPATRTTKAPVAAKPGSRGSSVKR